VDIPLSWDAECRRLRGRAPGKWGPVLSYGFCLFLAVLVGCSGDGPTTKVEGGPAMGPQLPEGARSSPVVVDIAVPSHDGPATLVVMGFHASQMEGGWSKEREAPQLYWFQEDLSVVASQEVSVPLAPDLVYVAALDLDLNRDINRGDVVSAPIVVGALSEEPLTMLLDRPFSPGPEPGGMDLVARPTTGGGSERSITVDSAFGMRFFPRGRLMVVGLPPGSTLAAREIERTGVTGRIEGSLGPRPTGSYPARVPPTFLWVSLPLDFDWPVRMDALLPDGLDTYVVLDLDRNGYPSTGDIASLCVCEMQRPKEGSPSVGFLLESVVPSNEQVADKLMPDRDREEDDPVDEEAQRPGGGPLLDDNQGDSGPEDGAGGESEPVDETQDAPGHRG